MKKIKKFLIVLSVVLTCTGCDQTTKYFASNLLEPHTIISYANDTFRIQYTENTGAFFGIGDSLSKESRFTIFTIAVALILSALFVYIVLDTRLGLLSVIACSTILGGGISNLYDRVVNDGAVVDFLNFGIGQLRTGIFNLADVFIFIGAAMLVLHHNAMNKPRHK